MLLCNSHRAGESVFLSRSLVSLAIPVLSVPCTLLFYGPFFFPLVSSAFPFPASIWFTVPRLPRLSDPAFSGPLNRDDSLGPGLEQTFFGRRSLVGAAQKLTETLEIEERVDRRRVDQPGKQMWTRDGPRVAFAVSHHS